MCSTGIVPWRAKIWNRQRPKRVDWPSESIEARTWPASIKDKTPMVILWYSIEHVVFYTQVTWSYEEERGISKGCSFLMRSSLSKHNVWGFRVKIGLDKQDKSLFAHFCWQCFQCLSIQSSHCCFGDQTHGSFWFVSIGHDVFIFIGPAALFSWPQPRGKWHRCRKDRWLDYRKGQWKLGCCLANIFWDAPSKAIQIP